jgi:hypothetical protein
LKGVESGEGDATTAADLSARGSAGGASGGSGALLLGGGVLNVCVGVFLSAALLLLLLPVVRALRPVRIVLLFLVRLRVVSAPRVCSALVCQELSLVQEGFVLIRLLRGADGGRFAALAQGALAADLSSGVEDGLTLGRGENAAGFALDATHGGGGGTATERTGSDAEGV